MRELADLEADLDDPRFSRDAAARARRILADAGYALEERDSADDAVLAWIDAEFGGWWSSEAHVSGNIVARRNGLPVGFASFDQRGLHFAWSPRSGDDAKVGVFGPFGVVEEERGGHLAPALLVLALASLRERGYVRALIPAVGGEGLVRYYGAHAAARMVRRWSPSHYLTAPARAVVMASGNGSNLQAVLDGAAQGRLPIEVASVVCNRADAFAIQRARLAGVEVCVAAWDRAGGESRGSYDARLIEAVADRRPALVLLLGWMHLLDKHFVEAMPALINVHPAFLPLDPERDVVGMPDGSAIPVFRGPNAVRDALAAGSRWAGASVHHVTADTDRGRVLTRAPLPLTQGESADGVLERLHPIEHALVSSAIWRWTYERAAQRHRGAA